jgi:nucleotide-binding universal stress UspA family protein
VSGPIVVGLDGSLRGADALALARMLARTCDAPVLLVAIASGVRRDRLGAATAAVQRAARPLAGVALAGERVLPGRSAARGLARLAEREAALLIVIGATARGGLARLAPGGVLERVAHLAPCPVAVAPAGYWGNPRQWLKRIGVAYLDSPDGRRALSAAVPLARRAGASLRLLEAAPAGPRSLSARVAAEQELWKASRETDGSPVERRLLAGAPSEVLRRAAAEVDLLVCGTHARGPLGGLLWPSVSARVARDAPAPVLIVPPGTEGRMRLLAGEPAVLPA